MSLLGNASKLCHVPRTVSCGGLATRGNLKFPRLDDVYRSPHRQTARMNNTTSTRRAVTRTVAAAFTFLLLALTLGACTDPPDKPTCTLSRSDGNGHVSIDIGCKIQKDDYDSYKNSSFTEKLGDGDSTAWKQLGTGAFIAVVGLVVIAGVRAAHVETQAENAALQQQEREAEAARQVEAAAAAERARQAAAQQEQERAVQQERARQAAEQHRIAEQQRMAEQQRQRAEAEAAAAEQERRIAEEMERIRAEEL